MHINQSYIYSISTIDDDYAQNLHPLTLTEHSSKYHGTVGEPIQYINLHRTVKSKSKVDAVIMVAGNVGMVLRESDRSHHPWHFCP